MDKEVIKAADNCDKELASMPTIHGPIIPTHIENNDSKTIHKLDNTNISENKLNFDLKKVNTAENKEMGSTKTDISMARKGRKEM